MKQKLVLWEVIMVKIVNNLDKDVDLILETI